MERVLALRDVMDHAVRVQKEITAITPIRRNRALLVTTLVCVPLLALCAYSFIARPAIIWGSSVEVPAAQQDANLRVGMFLIAQRVEGFRSTAGHYPTTLGEIGEAVEGLEYALVSDSVFELRGTHGGSTIVFRSTEPVEAFLGNSLSLIERRQ